ncbi:MAG: hypothetical protein U0031_01560 [Thermomicrobiales bacterium]
MNRRILVIGSLGAAFIAHRFTLAQESLPEPPHMTLRAANGQEQQGGIGTYCWATACVDKLGTPFPETPLDVAVGDPLLLDISVLGPVRQLAYDIWPYVPPRLAPQSPVVDESAPPLAKRRLRNPDSAISVPIDLPPGIYAIEVFADVRKGGDTYQGFTIRLLPTGSATPAATPVSKRGSATPVAAP